MDAGLFIKTKAKQIRVLQSERNFLTSLTTQNKNRKTTNQKQRSKRQEGAHTQEHKQLRLCEEK